MFYTVYALGVLDVLLRLFSSALIKVLDVILNFLPDVNIPVLEVPLLCYQIVNLLTYILPMGTLSAIFTLTLTITFFRFFLALVNKILQVLSAI